MEMADCVRSIVRRLLLKRMQHGQQKNIDELVSNLKQAGKYAAYPVKQFPPAIEKYSFFHKSDLKWLNFYFSVYGKPDQNLISVPVYLYIEECLNDRMAMFALKDKNVYKRLFSEIPAPLTILRRINGFFYDCEFNKVEKRDVMRYVGGQKKIILKPSVDSGSGHDILLFEDKGGALSNGESDFNLVFLDSYDKDFIIQEYVTQHQFFSQFNPTCNNTIKVFVYRSIRDDSVNLLHSILWVGARGKFMDHDHWGGFGLSINEDNKLNKYGIDIDGNKYEFVNNIVLSSLGEVPGMDSLRALAKQIAGKIFYGRLLAIDFTVQAQGKPLMLEINVRSNAIHQYQMHNGGLFREYTKEILDYCQNISPRAVVRI